MSNYVKNTNYTVKDGYTTGDSRKTVKGTELDGEFNDIADAIASKADTASPTFTGTPAAPTAAVNTNTTQLATTAFVVAEAADAVTDERTATATLTNKTLTSPTINGGSLTEITTLTLEGTTADAFETTIASEPTADRTITLPDATTTLVGRDTTDTLTNKTINASQLVDASVTPAKLSQPLTLGTAQATTSGTSIDFTGIPSWAKRVTVLFYNVSTNGTATVQIQLGTSAGPTTTGYLTSTWEFYASSSASTTGFNLDRVGSSVSNTTVRSGQVQFCNITGNTWTGVGQIARTDIAYANAIQGAVPLASTLDRIRITTVGGTDTFDAGSINIMYE